MSNGVRIIIRHMFDLFLDVEILTGQSYGKRIFLPKITLIPSDTDLPFRLCRVQFSIRLAYAMTINKSQEHASPMDNCMSPSPELALQTPSQSKLTRLRNMGNTDLDITPKTSCFVTFSFRNYFTSLHL